jgi:hypothetical protein
MPQHIRVPATARAEPGVAVVRGSTAGGTLAPAPPEADEDDELASGASRRRDRLMLVGIGAIVALALAGWASAFLLTGGRPTVTPTDRPAGVGANTASPQQVVHPVLPQPDVTVALEPDGIHFTWTYDDAEDGDFFRITRVDLNVPTTEDVTEPSYVIPADHACIDVRIIRSHGQVGPARRACYPAP